MVKSKLFVKSWRLSADVRGKILAFGLVLTFCLSGFAQPIPRSYEAFLSGLNTGDDVPDSLLFKRSVVLYDSRYDYGELKKIQGAFQRTGIDAVAHFSTDMIFANTDAFRAASRYFRKRAISFLVLLHKEDSIFSLSFTRFSGTPEMVTAQQPAWRVAGSNLDKVLGTVYRMATLDQPKGNWLINESPEVDFVLDIVRGKSLRFFAIDLKADKLAVPRLEKPSEDSVLVRFFEQNYPFRFGMVQGSEKDEELREKGFLYKLNYVYAYEGTARKLLNYSDEGGDTAPASEGMVYKFYVQHLFSGNVFSGTKWDALPSREESLKAHFDGLKKEFGL